MNNSVNVWPLMARVLNGEASQSEQEELFRILQENESLQHKYDVLCRIWSEKTGRKYISSADNTASEAVSKIIALAEREELQHEIELQPRRRFFTRRRLLISSFALAIVVIAAWVLKNNTTGNANDSGKAEIIVAQNGSRSRSMLPDGTTVWLNAGSKLFYENDFSGDIREVRLEGEAFFDVVKQERPFIVHTEGIDIKVLGTAFNVKSYPEDKTVETTLYRGSVSVSREKEPAKLVMLKPNEKLVMARNTASEKIELPVVNEVSVKNADEGYAISRIDSTKKEAERFETAWIYSRLEFRGDNFEQLARKMERWYNVRITLEDEKVKQLSFNGSFERETLEQALALLKIANGLFEYKINGNEISVSSP